MDSKVTKVSEVHRSRERPSAAVAKGHLVLLVDSLPVILFLGISSVVIETACDVLSVKNIVDVEPERESLHSTCVTESESVRYASVQSAVRRHLQVGCTLLFEVCCINSRVVPVVVIPVQVCTQPFVNTCLGTKSGLKLWSTADRNILEIQLRLLSLYRTIEIIVDISNGSTSVLPVTI